MVETAARIVRGGKALSRIWPGYWPEDQAFIFHAAGEGALLISPGPRPEGFEPMPPNELPSELRGQAYYRPGTMKEAGRPFSLDFTIGNGKTAVLVNYTRRGGAPIEGTAISATTLTLHEQFHDHQDTAFKPDNAGQFVDPLAVKDRVAFAAAAETEQRVLGAAVMARSAAVRKKLLQQYFALRQEREATISAEVRQVEQGFERIEGTAKYVDRVAHAYLFDAGAAGVPELIVKELEQNLMRSSGAFGTTWFRGRAYSTGAALSYLLSLYNPLWRQKVERGAQLDELLKDAVGMPAEGAALAQRARETFGYEARRRRLDTPIQEAEKKEIKSVEEFLALGAYAVTLDIENPKEGPSALRRGFSARDMVDLRPTILALPTAFTYSLSGLRTALAVKERPVLQETKGTRAETTVLLPSPPRAEGLGEFSIGEYRLERLKLSAPGYELTLDRPVLVTIGPRRMHIKVSTRGNSPGKH
ncbi:MAG TPA: hypothetical protein VE891_12520 [Allosphingosinicella sp.]|nr:hypothetical protein [Allosphingosinicella sp.]